MQDALDALSIAILEHCTEGGRLAGLRAQFPSSTLYRKAKKLIRRGLLAKEGDVYRTSDRGRQALGSPALQSGLEKPIPQLRFAPTPVHRAVLELVAAAAVVRRHGARDDHHATFVLVGATLMWKSWTGKLACAIFDLDPVDHIVLSNAESGRSLFTRRGFAGKTVSKRSSLSAPLVIIDEFHKADAETRRMADVYLSGSRVMSYENERLEVRPVPLFAMNPLEGDTLEERTGLDPAQIRRCVIADFSKIVIPDDLRPRGEEFLAEAKKAGPIDLRGLRPGDCSEFRGVVTEALDRCLVPEARARVDAELVVQLAEGMAGFVPPAQAWVIAVLDLVTVWETLGWTSPGWRLRLSTARPEDKERARGRMPARRGPPSLREETLRVLAAARQVPRDLGLAKLIKAEKGELRDKRAELAELHRRMGTTPKEIEGFVKVRQQLKDAGVTWDDPTMRWAARFMAENGPDANAVACLAYELFSRGIKGGDADLFLKSLPSGKTWDQAMAWLGDLTRQYGSLDAVVRAKAAEERAASARVAEAKAHEEQILVESTNAQAELNRVRADSAAMQEKLAATRAEIARITTDLGKIKAEQAAVGSDLERRKDELHSTEERLEARRHLAAMYRALESALLGDEAQARRVLQSLGSEGGADSVRLLRELTSRATGRSRATRGRGGRRMTGTGAARRVSTHRGRGHRS